MSINAYRVTSFTRKRKIVTTLFYIVAVILLSGSAFGQKIRFSGVIYDKSGAVIVGASIRATDVKGQVMVGKSDGGGSFAIELVPATYVVEIASPGFWTARIAEFLVVDSTHGTLTRDFVLFGRTDHEPCGPGGECLPSEPIKVPAAGKREDKINHRKTDDLDLSTLAGSVYDDFGSLVPNAIVRLLGKDKVEAVTKTDANGEYEIKVKPGNYSIEIQSRGFQLTKIEEYRVMPTHGGRQTLDITLEVRPCDDCDMIDNDNIKQQ